MRTSLLALSLTLVPASGTWACSCIGNSSFCETVDPDWFVNPDATALVVKLSSSYYGIQVKVVRTLNGVELPDDTLTVWGDNGGLCRIYLAGIADGDTMVFGLNHTDLMGNSVWNPDYPADLEEEDDYMVSGCGVYSLNYTNGRVTGPITAGEIQSMSWEEFTEAVNTCNGTLGVDDPTTEGPLTVQYATDGPWLALATPGRYSLTVSDNMGRICMNTGWDGSRRSLLGLAAGAYVVSLSNGEQRWSKKVLIGSTR